MSYRRIASIAAFTAIGCLSGCASAGGVGSSGCTSDLRPSTRSLNEVLDSAWTQSEVARLLRPEVGLVVARVGGATDEVWSAVRVWSETLSDSLEAELTAVLHTATRIRLDSEERAYVFLGDHSGSEIRRVERVAQCAPEILNERSVARRISDESRDLGIMERVLVRLFVHVERDGSVREVRVDESSGDATVDVAAASVFRNVRFTPARIEGMPVAVWVRFPVTFTPR